MGRNARLKRERREKRQSRCHEQRTRLGFSLEPCSNRRNCPEHRPPGTHVLMLPGGNNYSSCDSCVQEMMLALKAEGIDAQVATVDALAHMRQHPPTTPVPSP